MRRSVLSFKSACLMCFGFVTRLNSTLFFSFFLLFIKIIILKGKAKNVSFRKQLKTFPVVFRRGCGMCVNFIFDSGIDRRL